MYSVGCNQTICITPGAAETLLLDSNSQVVVLITREVCQVLKMVEFRSKLYWWSLTSQRGWLDFNSFIIFAHICCNVLSCLVFVVSRAHIYFLYFFYHNCCLFVIHPCIYCLISCDYIISRSGLHIFSMVFYVAVFHHPYLEVFIFIECSNYVIPKSWNPTKHPNNYLMSSTIFFFCRIYVIPQYFQNHLRKLKYNFSYVYILGPQH